MPQTEQQVGRKQQNVVRCLETHQNVLPQTDRTTRGETLPKQASKTRISLTGRAAIQRPGLHLRNSRDQNLHQYRGMILVPLTE